MKTIATLKGPDFLRACNRVRHAVEKFLRSTGVGELRKIIPDNLPEVPETATEDEKKRIQAERERLLEAQGRRNFSAMLDRMLEEKPEETYELLLSLVIQEKDKDGNLLEPDGYDLLSAGMEVLTTPKMMDFFAKLVPMVETITGD